MVEVNHKINLFINHLGIKKLILGEGFGILIMASLSETLSDFKEFKNRAPKSGLVASALNGIKKKIVVLIPGNNTPELRWALTVLSLQLVWSASAPGSVITGAFFTLLTIFADQPGQLLRTVGNDPDIEAQIVEVIPNKDGGLKLSSRGLDLSKQQERYQRIAAEGEPDTREVNPFLKQDLTDLYVRTTEMLQNALATITLQIWILLTKAVTAPDTARDSEQRRWIKYLQQKKAYDSYQLKPKWLDVARNRMAEDISIRRLMVEILVEINKIPGTKSRILEMIADVGNYIAETGMAGFHLTIKYGLETRYPALALNEFQGDLTTIIQLMKLYKEQGDRAPYLVILEDAVQTKFSPGNYPLLWSYAMGIGTTIDRAMNGLNYNRPYLEPNFFRLGQDIVNKLDGNVDSKRAEELGLTQTQIDELKNLAQGTTQDRAVGPAMTRTSKFVPATMDDPDAEDDEVSFEHYKRTQRAAEAKKSSAAVGGAIPKTKIKATPEEEALFRNNLQMFASTLAPKSNKTSPQASADTTSTAGSTDMALMRA
ncbi:nucleocapsid protein [Wenzhou Myotis davidii paramyxovirus 1]|uniref:Nucleocapsid n=1 Tax=Wenzhou Myotis davidii paramyxovirus 1 TaxID=2928979 RepID=A0A8T9KMB9_9MONO|nr:nucleocapsid protein [Wenzhou Myotis davidii paramyxovirus 1]WPV62569.1 MAG: nucleocapsid protein [Wenzhou bat jeilongvirus 1]